MPVQLQIYKREEIPLDIHERAEHGKGEVGRMRRNGGMLPGVVYGHRQDPTSFKVETRSLERALSQGGQNAVFLLHGGAGREGERAVVREIQYHKVSGDILHVDLLRIDPEERLRIEVPVTTSGSAAGVSIGGGALQHSLQRLEMQCLASELPSRVEIDISDLEIGDSIHVGDLIAQDDRILTDPAITIVSVLSPRLTVDEELELAQAEEAEELEEGEEPVEGEEGAPVAEEAEGGDGGGGGDES